MKRLVNLIAAILAVLTTILVPAGPSSAQPWRHPVHLAYADTGVYYGSCRIGWWQTLWYGHVRPRWAVHCR